MASDRSIIEIHREIGVFGDNLRSYAVVIDDEVVDRLYVGQSCAIELPPGFHEVFLKIDWSRSEKIRVELAAGETAKFLCGPRSNPITIFYWITIGRHRAVRLARVA